jgi:NAD(P)-dependent dehydrogenase (short-subunit alcohol dehydrogenase family)
LVTGGAGGIGVAAVHALATEGARVLATHHHTAPPAVPGVEWVQCDVTDPADVADLFAATGDRFGGLDVLVHTAGAWLPGIPGQIEMSDLDTVMTTNFTSTVLTNQAAFELMRETGGQIINFGSAEAVMGSPLAAGYSAAKAAVAAWTRSIARAWAPHRVTANALAPAVDTPGAQRLREFLGPEALPFLEQQLQHSIPLGGALGDPLRDIGPVVVFLSSSGAGFVTGQLIAVDGGLTMLGS